MTAQIYIPTNSVQGSPSLHILSNFCYLWSFWWWPFWQVVLPWWLSGKAPSCQCRRCRFDPWPERIPEKKMTTHSSILAWEIPWTEEPAGLQFMGSQKVRHNWTTEQQQCWLVFNGISLWFWFYISLIISDAEHIFLCLLGQLYVFFGKMSLRVSAHFLMVLFVFLRLGCISCLHILDSDPLSVISFAKTFSHSVGCFFILSMVSFATQKHLIRLHYVFLFWERMRVTHSTPKHGCRPHF